MTEAQLIVQNIGGVSVVDLSDASILDGPTIQTIARRLYALVDEQAQRKILLVFSRVRFLSSSMLGVLIEMRKRSQAIRGRVAICGLRPELRKVFRITRTEKMFEFHDAEEPALNSFGVYTSP